MSVLETERERTIEEQDAFVQEFIDRFDAVEVATYEERCAIFARQKAKGVSDTRLKQLLVEVYGKPSTRELPRAHVRTILTALEA